MMKSPNITLSCCVVVVIVFCLSSFKSNIKVGNHAEARQEHGAVSNSTTLSTSLQSAFGRASSIRIYKLDIHSYKKELKYAGDPAFVNSSGTDHKARCAQNLNHYRQLLDSFYQFDPVNSSLLMDSIKLADTFGRPEPGLLLGNQHWLGEYKSCLKFKHRPTKSGDSAGIKAQYCIGAAQFSDWNQSKEKLPVMTKLGLCLPETCTTSMLNENQELFDTVNHMMKLALGTKPFNQLDLKEIYCLPHETSQLRQYSRSTRNFFIFVGAVTTVCVLATMLDHCTTSKEEENKDPERPEPLGCIKLIRALSLTRNMQKLLHVQDLEQTHEKKTNNEDDFNVDNDSDYDDDDDEDEDGKVEVFDKNALLGSLAGLKCLSLVLIISTHILIGSFTLARNLIEFDDHINSLLVNIILASNFMPDTFFAISGLLASYFMFTAGVHKIKVKHWIALIIHRYWRLTPLYIIVLWFAKSVTVQINSGPLWDYATSETSMRRVCSEESWTHAFFYMCDLKSVKEHCMPVAWFIANSFKFFMVTPFFITAIHKSTRFGYALLIGTLLANIILVFTLASRSAINFDLVLHRKPEALDDMIVNFETVYLRPYSRIGPYLVGLFVGHLFYRMETNQLRVKLSRNLKLIIWTWFAATLAIHILAVRLSPASLGLDTTVAPYAIALIVALVRPSWALLTCWFLFALSTGKLPRTTRFLSAKFFRILVRLSFSLYLIHCEVLYQIYMPEKITTYFSSTELALRPLTLTVVSLFASLIMVLLFEYPLMGIEKLFTGGREKLEEQIDSNENQDSDQQPQKYTATYKSKKA